MIELTETAVRDKLIRLIREIREDWDMPGTVDENTGLFRNLGFESIDAVALGAEIEDRFKQSLPFAEFLTKAREENWEDISIGQLLGFLLEHLRPMAQGQAI